MKAVIDGLTYNTETAEEIASDSYGNASDFSAWEETLYRTPKGAFFTAGTGGATTKYARIVAPNDTTGGSKIFPLSEESALVWAENHASFDTIKEFFGELLSEA